jgi:hypothetical protein
MASEFGKRRAEIMSFLKGLDEREKLVVLTYLSNDAAISARIPNLARTVLDMHRAYHKFELLEFVEGEHSNLDLEFLARRKGCRLEHAKGPGDRWRIVQAGDRGVRLGLVGSGPKRIALTRKQALEVLRSLPDQQSKA